MCRFSIYRSTETPLIRQFSERNRCSARPGFETGVGSSGSSVGGGSSSSSLRRPHTANTAGSTPSPTPHSAAVFATPDGHLPSSSVSSPCCGSPSLHHRPQPTSSVVSGGLSFGFDEPDAATTAAAATVTVRQQRPALCVAPLLAASDTSGHVDQVHRQHALTLCYHLKHGMLL